MLITLTKLDFPAIEELALNYYVRHYRPSVTRPSINKRKVLDRHTYCKRYSFHGTNSKTLIS